MERLRKRKEEPQIYPMGAVKTENGMHFSIASVKESCSLVFFEQGKTEPVQTIPLLPEDKIGDVWNITLEGDFRGLAYAYLFDGVLCEDPYGRHFSGRENWGEKYEENRVLHALFSEKEYDWEGDVHPQLSYENSVIYRLHPRGFTRHSSSKVKSRGTFAGITEKIPYLQELGITTVELLPCIEFNEVIPEDKTIWKLDKKFEKFLRKKPEKSSEKQDQKRLEKKAEEEKINVNYWGFIPGLSFAPKASYCSKKEKYPGWEFKDMVKAFHRAGMEVIMDIFFSGQEPQMQVVDVLRYWVQEYHVDGFHLVGFAPVSLLGSDPYLSRVKLFYPSWDGVSRGKYRHLAIYNDYFQNEMRRFLKGDENLLNSLIFHNRRNPADCGVINYMANSNGFTMMDNVSYDTKHNEANGENNQDGTDANASWNCGVEGPCRKKKVMEMRRKQIRNSFLLTFLSQGTPLLLAGDEFGNTQNGNNNAWCQDNEISWLNWNQVKTNADILGFAKEVIRFRKKHPMFHLKQEPKVLDYLSCGMPDISYHGTKAWFPEFESFRRQLGILYCGTYAAQDGGEEDDCFFAAYNMHWEPHEFSLPNLPKGMKWHIVFNTDAKEVQGFYPEGEEKLLEKQKFFMVQPRSIVVFIGKKLCSKTEENIGKKLCGEAGEE